MSQPAASTGARPLSIAGRVERWRTIVGGRPPCGPRGSPLAVVNHFALEPHSEWRTGDAIWLVPPDGAAVSFATLVGLIPDPCPVSGALVVISSGGQTTSFFSRLWKAPTPVPRALRGSALLLKGYRAIAGGIDPSSGLDLIWGESGDVPYSPSAIASSNGTAI